MTNPEDVKSKVCETTDSTTSSSSSSSSTTTPSHDSGKLAERTATATTAQDGTDEVVGEVADEVADEVAGLQEKAPLGLAPESVVLSIVYKKQKHRVEALLDDTVATLKKQLHSIIDVPPAMQKLMIRGLAPDSRSLRELGVVTGAKVMVVGSTLSEVLSVAKPDAKSSKEDLCSTAETPRQKFSEMKNHKKIIDKGIPDDAMPCRLNTHEPLPLAPLSGMLNRTGGKVRLTFKMEADQLWLGTKERTEKLSMSSIKTVVSEPITGHDGYHIMGIQLGPTEASRYWIYWMPCQYVNAIKDAVLGKWQYF